MLTRLACGLHDAFFGSDQLSWALYRLAIGCLFVGVIVARDRVEDSRGPVRIKGESLLLWLLCYATLVLMWLPNFARGQINPDESQWIAQANNLAADSLLWVRYFLPCNLTRLLTIVPLGALGLTGVQLGYETARLVGLAMWAGVAACLFVAARPVFGFFAALWSAAILVLVVGSFTFFDFVAYNSELPVALLCVAAVASLTQSLSCPKRVDLAILAGLLVAAIPFAKDQGLPLAAVVGAGGVVILASLRRWKQVASVVAGGLVWAALIAVPLVASGNIREAFDWLQVTRDHAVHRTYFAQEGFANQMSILGYLLTIQEMRALTLTACAAFPMLAAAWFTNRWRATGLQRGVALWFMAMFVAAAAAAIFPIQRFEHYGVLLMAPSALAMAPLLHLGLQAWRPSPWFVGSAAVLWLLLPFTFAPDGELGQQGFAHLTAQCCMPCEEAFTPALRKLASPGDRLLIWGWANSYFVETGLLQGSRMMYPSMAIGNYRTREANLRRYAEDMDTLRPEFILEWVGDDAFHFNGPRAVPMADIPDLGRRLADRYVLVAKAGNEKLYLRADTLTARKP